MLFDYDDEDVESILQYANKLVGISYNDILNACREYIKAYDKGDISNRDKSFVDSLRNDKLINNKNAKGQLGNFIEKYYFGYTPNGNQEADLNKVGIEIKQTPIDYKANGDMRAGERLSITMISYKEPVEDNFYKSHVWDKIKNILFIFYVRDKSKPRLDYQIKYVKLFTPPKEDLDIIIEDYNNINKKIREGKAHEISEGDTLYLGACTKGSTAESSLQPQYYNSSVLAKRRNFCFKQSYMNYVLHTYILNEKNDLEPIKRNKNFSFEESIIDKISKYYGKSDSELSKELNLKRNKAFWSQSVYRILGIKSNKAEEFIKANIKIKTIRVEEDGGINEHMPLPTFKFKDLVNQEWEQSTLYHLLSETKYLMVFYYHSDEEYYLKKVQFWNMPYQDLETIVKYEWESVRDTIREGVTFEMDSRGRITNNLLGPSDSQIIHVRPHASKSAYRLHNGFEKGKIQDCDELPNGEMMTRQSFWINKNYLVKQFQLK